MGPDQRRFTGSPTMPCNCHVNRKACWKAKPRNLLWVQMVQLKLLMNSFFYSHNVKFYRELKSILKIFCFLPTLRMLTILFTVNHNPVWHPWKTVFYYTLVYSYVIRLIKNIENRKMVSLERYAEKQIINQLNIICIHIHEEINSRCESPLTRKWLSSRLTRFDEWVAKANGSQKLMNSSTLSYKFGTCSFWQRFM